MRKVETWGNVGIEFFLGGAAKSIPIVIWRLEPRTAEFHSTLNIHDARARAKAVAEISEDLRADADKILMSFGMELLNCPVDMEADSPRGVAFEALEPWPFPVAGGPLLTTITEAVRKYVSVPVGADIAVGLWVMHAYCIDACTQSPILSLSSPVRQCGKTRLLEVLSALVPKPWMSVDPSNATLFRLIEKYTPTLLIDEADNLGMKDRKDLLGLVNGGYTRSTARVARCDGENFDVRMFGTWAPKVFAGIGKLPETTASRSIVGRLERKPTALRLPRLRADRLSEEMLPVRRQALRWSLDNLETIRNADPALPEQLGDREGDNWRPLLAIADIAGEEWGEAARGAATQSCRPIEGEEIDDPTQLLVDIRDCFDADGSERMPTRRILDALLAREDRRWGEWKDARPMTAIQLAAVLRRFHVRPTAHRPMGGGEPFKGYKRSDFEPAWLRYASSTVGAAPQPPHTLRVTEDVTELNTSRGMDVTDVTTEFAWGACERCGRNLRHCVSGVRRCSVCRGEDPADPFVEQTPVARKPAA